MTEPFKQLRLTPWIWAAVANLIPQHLTLARGTAGGHLKFREHATSARWDRTHHLWNHVARLLQDHHIANTHVLAPNLVNVVERRTSHRRACKEYGLHLGDRCEVTSATNLDHNVEQRRGDLFGGELVCDRPFR